MFLQEVPPGKYQMVARLKYEKKEGCFFTLLQVNVHVGLPPEGFCALPKSWQCKERILPLPHQINLDISKAGSHGWFGRRSAGCSRSKSLAAWWST